MPVPLKDSEPPTSAQLASLVGDAWETTVVPRLPADLTEQARALGAFQRVREVATPTDLLRALLVFVLDDVSTRGLGAWAVLTGVADISATAWRQRLGRSAAWLGWLLGEVLTGAVAQPAALARRGRRVRLIDATRLAQLGGVGDDWRVHLSYDLLASRMDEVIVTDRHTAEGLAHFTLVAGDIIVSDGGYGYRSQVMTARAAEADVVVRIDPRTCPLADAAGQPFDVEGWLDDLERRHVPQAEWGGWCVVEGQRQPVRLLASALPPAECQRARQQKQRRAHQKGRRLSARTLRLAGWWLLLTTLDDVWTAADIVRLYRARWQVELLFKRLKQLLRQQPIRARTRAMAEATVRAVLVAWALQEHLAATVQAGLAAARSPDRARSVSLWRVAQLSLGTLAAAARGAWTLAHLHACLPRLARFLCDTPRRRVQQAATMRAWLDAHPGRTLAPRQVAA